MRAALLLASLLVAAAPVARADGVRLVPVGTFAQPTYVTAPPGDARLYVVELAGVVRVVADGATLAQPFLDLGGLVNAGGERGLFSLAFDPQYPTSRLVYVAFTDATGALRVREYRTSVDPARADPGSGRDVITIPHPTFENHNGGQLQFGPDGFLYLGTGDGGSSGDPAGHGQSLATLSAKLLRIDPHLQPGGAPYGIPADNPFVGVQGARPEIEAYGLRNPWRFSFDGSTLLLADVGQDLWEEVDVQALAAMRGANLGWSCDEGAHAYLPNQGVAACRSLAASDAWLRPALEYRHEDGACSVTGGVVVHDRRLPALAGRYLYGDYCRGDLRSFVPAPGGPAADDQPLGAHVDLLDSFGVDGAGHVYAVSGAGPVYRLDKLANAPPTASFQATPPQPASGADVALDASASSDPDGSLVRYAWEWTGDATPDAGGPTATARFDAAGPHQVSLAVTDDDGASALASVVVDVAGAPGAAPPGPAQTGSTPTAALAAPAGQRLSTVLARGLLASLRLPAPVSLRLAATISPGQARALGWHGASRRITIASASRRAGGAFAWRLRPGATARGRIGRLRTGRSLYVRLLLTGPGVRLTLSIAVRRQG